MSVNLNKNKQQILDAWKKVTENEDGYDWAIFGYEGKSYDLKVDAIGSGGIEAVAEEINEGKIQYAFVRILDPNTQLVKLLLINFQGEAVLDLVHKGTCSNHLSDIRRLLKNHLTITASNIDELDENEILKKMSKITSSYNFQDRAAPTEEKFAIGTNYSKVVPTKEINSSKRDEFWRQEAEVEEARIASETEARKIANKKLEEERLKREQSEHLKREQFNKEPEKQKIVPPPAAKPVSPAKVEKDESSKPRAEEMRQDRRKEAQELIGNRVNTAKALFQQQAAQNATPVNTGPPAKPIRKTKVEQEIVTVEPRAPAMKIDVAPAKIDLPVVEAEPFLPPNDDCDEQFSTIKRSPKTPTTPDNKQDNGFTAATTDNENVQQTIETTQTKEIDIVQQVEEDDASPTELLKAVALYDYQAVDETEISFDPGDVITHIDQIDEGWWQGFSVRFNSYGLFPANYVELIN